MYVRVEVRAGAKKEAVIQTDAKTYTIAVKEPAARNLANMRVREVLARLLGLPVPAVRMISGHRSPRKIFDISN
ncbi:MAG: DUF167 family protein [Minisyncoccia bacterium]